MSRYRASNELDEAAADLILEGFEGDLDYISKSLDILPTVKIRKGERKNPHASPRELSFWRYTLKGAVNEEPEDVLEKLLALLRPNYEFLQKLSKSCTVLIGIGSYRYWYNQEFFVSPEQLSELNKINATLWIDAYCFTETYLEEQQQKENLVHALKVSKAANNQGITTDQDRKALVELLANIETLKNDIFTDMFPYYAGDELATDEDIEKALITTRERIKDICKLTKKSTFFSGK